MITEQASTEEHLPRTQQQPPDAIPWNDNDTWFIEAGYTLPYREMQVFERIQEESGLDDNKLTEKIMREYIQKRMAENN